MGLGILGKSVSGGNVQRSRESARYAGGFAERRLLPIAATLVAPFLIVGYVALAVLCLPLLGLRGILPRSWRGRARRDTIAGSALATASA